MRSLAAAKGLVYGAATGGAVLGEADFASTFAREAGLLVPENDAKWAQLRPSEDIFDFTLLDQLVAFAGAHRQAFRGHTLVWHRYMPKWVTRAIAAGRGTELLARHITTVVGRYCGRAQSWDVVNEAVDAESRRADKLRETPWLRTLGPDYISRAFDLARRADPTTKLVYNDYGLEYSYVGGAAKREAVLELLRKLRERGLVDGLGIEGHLAVDETLDARMIRAFIRDAGTLGLEVYISELDVNDRSIQGDDASRDDAIAAHLESFLTPVLSEPAVKKVITWGLSTRYSWLNSVRPFRRADGRPTRGLPFDENMQRTAMGNVLAKAFVRAPARCPARHEA